MKDLVRERQVSMLALSLALWCGRITTTQLRQACREVFEPVGRNLKPLKNRSDTSWTQIVRNVISHKDVNTSFFKRGLLIYHARSRAITATHEGQQYLLAIINRGAK